MSPLPFELQLALRYLRPKRTFVSVITLISIIGVMLGVAVLIIVISVMTGFDQELRKKILGFNPHLKVTSFNARGKIADHRELLEKVRANPDVTSAAPYIESHLLVGTQNNGAEERDYIPQCLRGVDPKSIAGIDIIPGSM